MSGYGLNPLRTILGCDEPSGFAQTNRFLQKPCRNFKYIRIIRRLRPKVNIFIWPVSFLSDAIFRTKARRAPIRLRILAGWPSYLVPLRKRVYLCCLLCSLGILGDEKNHQYPLYRAYILYGFCIGVCW